MARTRKTPGEALVEQGWAIHDWLTELPAEAYERETVLPGWDVRALLAHVAQLLDGMLAVLARPTREAPLTNDVLVGRYGGAADQMSRRVLDHAAAYDVPALLDRLAGTLDRAAA
ncbi:MAG: maleylpyruvate isomerase N-terminal domain-containing protein, partial [Janthinobacterium lividum]